MFSVENITNVKTGACVKVTPLESIVINEEIVFKPRPCILKAELAKYLERFKNFSVRDDDVWIVTFPKCGTTWAQEMCWLILNNFDFETAKKVGLVERAPFWEFSAVLPHLPYDTMEDVDNLKSPRLIKTHLPLPILPNDMWKKNAKIIYVVRDPRDVAISFYHFWKGVAGYEGSKEEFLKAFIEGQLSPCPFWDHVLEFWKLKDQPNVLFLNYEDMKRDLAEVIRKVSKFFNKSITEQQMEKLVDHLSFENMKNNPMCNHESKESALFIPPGMGEGENGFRFMRRGIVGSHKDEIPESYIELFDDWIKKNLQQSDFNLYL